MNKEIVSLVQKHTKDTGVDPALVLSIMQVESGGNAYAVRYEQNYRWTLPQAKRPATCSQNTETVMQKTSWGLMQIMGAVAREYGFTDWLSKLVDPDVNIAIGVAYLVGLSKRFVKNFGVDGVIAAYNAGSPRVESDGKFFNQKYVDCVKKAMGDMKALVSENIPSTPQAAGKKSSTKVAEAPAAGETERIKKEAKK